MRGGCSCSRTPSSRRGSTSSRRIKSRLHDHKHTIAAFKISFRIFVHSEKSSSSSKFWDQSLFLLRPQHSSWCIYLSSFFWFGNSAFFFLANKPFYSHVFAKKYFLVLTGADLLVLLIIVRIKNKVPSRNLTLSIIRIFTTIKHLLTLPLKQFFSFCSFLNTFYEKWS